jgi:hypothetical protein
MEPQDRVRPAQTGAPSKDFLVKFATDQKGALRAVPAKILNLPDEDQQRLVRGMLAGPAVVERPEAGDGIGDGPLMEWLDFSFRFNTLMLKEILDEGSGSENR